MSVVAIADGTFTKLVAGRVANQFGLYDPEETASFRPASIEGKTLDVPADPDNTTPGIVAIGWNKELPRINGSLPNTSYDDVEVFMAENYAPQMIEQHLIVNATFDGQAITLPVRHVSGIAYHLIHDGTAAYDVTQNGAELRIEDASAQHAPVITSIVWQ